MKKTKLSFVLSAFLALGTTNIYAQEITELDEIVTTGSLTETLAKEIPAAVEVFSAKEIKEMGATDVKDVLRQTKNIETQGQKGGVNIRGFGANYSVVLINGRKVSGLDAAKDSQNLILDSIDVNNIQRVEVLRGQAGALYGSNAIGGVINIITKKAKEQSTTVSLTASNDGTKGSVSFDSGQMGKYDVILNASSMNVDGIYADEFPTGESKTRGLKQAFSFDSGYKIDENNEIRWAGNFFEKETRTVSKDITGRNGISDSETPAKQRTLGTSLVYNGSSEDSMWSTGLSYSQSQNYLYEGSKRFDASKIDRFEYMSLDGKFNTAINDYNIFTIGAELVNETTDQETAVDGDNLAHASVFAQNEMSLMDGKFNIVPMVRYDYYFDTFGSNITPSIGSTYFINNNHRIKTSVGLGFKAPTITELYGRETRSTGGTGIITPGRGYYVYGNKDLDPEKSTNFELIYEAEFTKDTKGSIGYYFSDIKDKISTAVKGTNPISGNDDFTAINIDEAQVQGIEAMYDVRFNQYFGMTLDYNYVDARNKETNERLEGNAQNIFGLGFDAKYNKLSARVWSKYNHNYLDVEQDEHTFNYYTTNASLTYELSKDKTLSFGAYNFLSTDANELNNQVIDPAEYQVTFTMKF